MAISDLSNPRSGPMRWSSFGNHPKHPQKRHEEKIDAALCLIIALQLRRQSNGVRVIGNLDKGYIVTPTSGKTRRIL